MKGMIYFSLMIALTVDFGSKCAEVNTDVDLVSIGPRMPAVKPKMWNNGIEQQNILCIES